MGPDLTDLRDKTHVIRQELFWKSIYESYSGRDIELDFVNYGTKRGSDSDSGPRVCEKWE